METVAELGLISWAHDELVSKTSQEVFDSTQIYVSQAAANVGRNVLTWYGIAKSYLFGSSTDAYIFLNRIRETRSTMESYYNNPSYRCGGNVEMPSTLINEGPQRSQSTWWLSPVIDLLPVEALEQCFYSTDACKSIFTN